MENASKALIIAGSILIAILIISLAVLVFNNFGGTAKEMANMDEEEIQLFNSKLTPYLGKSISGSKVNTLLQYCLTNNMSATNSGETYKRITVTGVSELKGDGTDTSYTKVETSGKYYTVTGTYDGSTGLITKINITQNE